MKNEDLHALRTNPGVVPVELRLTSGDKLRIPPPDYVHCARKPEKIFYCPEEGGGLFEWIRPEQMVNIRGRAKRGHPRAA